MNTDTSSKDFYDSVLGLVKSQGYDLVKTVKAVISGTPDFQIWERKSDGDKFAMPSKIKLRYTANTVCHFIGVPPMFTEGG